MNNSDKYKLDPQRQQPPVDNDLLARLRRRCSNDRLWSTGAEKSDPEQLTFEEQDDR